jgi:hypothetical protein
MASLMLNLTISWSSAVSFMSQLIYAQQKSPHSLQYRRLGGPKSQSGHFEEQKNLLPLED